MSAITLAWTWGGIIIVANATSAAFLGPVVWVPLAMGAPVVLPFMPDTSWPPLELVPHEARTRVPAKAVGRARLRRVCVIEVDSLRCLYGFCGCVCALAGAPRRERGRVDRRGYARPPVLEAGGHDPVQAGRVVN